MKAVILAGGSGTRLWPLSKKHSPKQLHKLVSNKTLLQQTIDRLDFLKPQDIYIATNKEYAKEVARQMSPVPKSNLIIEPAMRDTATCIGYAAALIGEKFPHETMSIIYSDHLIKEKKTFQAKLKVADFLAQTKGTVNIIEVKARYPSTVYGYVMLSEAVEVINGHEVCGFEKFIEKPNLETAKKFVDSFKYLWNTGLYVWRIDTILSAYKKFLPDTYAHLQNMIQHPSRMEAEYKACAKISIDYGIMEKIDKDNVRILPANLGWSDIGTWSALYGELAEKAESNVCKGKLVTQDTKGSLIYNYTDKVIATLGVKDLIIVETDEALLVCHKEKAGDLKALMNEVGIHYKELL